MKPASEKRGSVSQQALKNPTPKVSTVGSKKSVAQSVTPSDTITDDAPLSANIILDCVKIGDLTRLSRCFEDPRDPYYQLTNDMMKQRSEEDGRTALDLAAMLGSAELVSFLIKHGAVVNGTNEKGYSPLHYASTWNRVQCLKVLVELGADLHIKTVNGERAIDIAMRYKHNESIDILKIFDARCELKEAIIAVKENVTKNAKLFSAEEKASLTSLVRTKLEWLETSGDAPLEEILSTKADFDSVISTIMVNKPNVSIS